MSGTIETNNQISVSKEDRAPEEAALILRVRGFIKLRWIGIAGLLLATVVASEVFHIGFPALPVYILSAFTAIYNFVLQQQLRSAIRGRPDRIVPKVRTYSYIHITLDLFTLAFLLHFTGGIENPFIFFFVLHAIGVSTTLHYRSVYILSTLAILLVAALVTLEYTGVIPHHNLEGYAAPTLYRQTSYILAVLVALAIVLFTATYMASAVSGELRKRQRELMQMRDRLIEERTGELRSAASEINKLEEEKARFLRFIGIAAHDLKAPLTAIQGFLWVMLGGFAGAISEKQKNILERCTHRISELLNLISDLLDIPRIETGQIVQEMKETSLLQIITESIEDQRNLATEKGLEIEVKLPERLSQVKGSAPRLHQVMTNLLNNAINYTANGKITVKAMEQNDDILVEVIDNGIGIPSQDLPRIFEDFFRASNASSKGTGLGLSISRRIIEAHGGKIWVNSPCAETGAVTKFSFSIPKQRENTEKRC